MSRAPFLLILILTAGSAAADPFDPTEFLKQEEFAEAKKLEDVKVVYVKVGGLVFRRLDTQAGTLLVPRTAPGELREVELVRSRCVRVDDEAKLTVVATPPGEDGFGEQLKDMVYRVLTTAQHKCGRDQPK